MGSVLTTRMIAVLVAIAGATVAVIVALVVVFGGDGDGGDGGATEDRDAEEMAQAVFEAISEEGMVYHAIGGDTEVWIDVDDQRYRERQVTADGDRISIGEGWTVTRYDPTLNEVTTTDESLGSVNMRPRIDDPAINFLEALGALAFAQELTLLGERVSQEGDTVIVLEARSPIVENNEPTGRTLIGRLELEPDTLLLSAFERSERLPLDATAPPEDPLNPSVRRTIYTTSEMIPEGELAEGFFDPQVAEDAVLTLEDKIQLARDLGIEIYWWGEQYEDDLGQLILQPDEGGFIVNTPVAGLETTPEASLYYTTPAVDPGGETVLLGRSVIVYLWPADMAQFGQPEVEGFAQGNIPEGQRDVTVRGTEAVLFNSQLRVQDAPCPSGLECPESDAPLYHRLVVALGDTAMQIETHAKVAPEGDDRNPYNNPDAILAIAEALTTP